MMTNKDKRINLLMNIEALLMESDLEWYIHYDPDEQAYIFKIEKEEFEEE